jgi:hypothetical protein
MGGPAAVPSIAAPGWLAGTQAALSGATGMALGALERLHALANAVNPLAGRRNCSSIIDAVIARFTGSNPNATATAYNRDGKWRKIQERHDTTFAGGSFQDAFAAVAAGGPGTAAVVGVRYPPDPANPNARATAHVVAVVNDSGTVAVIEAQQVSAAHPRGPITDAAEAARRYGTSSDVGFGIVGAGAPPPGTRLAWPPKRSSP